MLYQLPRERNRTAEHLSAEVEAIFWDDRTLLGVIIACSEVTGSPAGHDALTLFVARELRAAALAEIRRRGGWSGVPWPDLPVRRLNEISDMNGSNQ